MLATRWVLGLAMSINVVGLVNRPRLVRFGVRKARRVGKISGVSMFGVRLVKVDKVA